MLSFSYSPKHASWIYLSTFFPSSEYCAWSCSTIQMLRRISWSLLPFDYEVNAWIEQLLAVWVLLSQAVCTPFEANVLFETVGFQYFPTSRHVKHRHVILRNNIQKRVISLNHLYIQDMRAHSCLLNLQIHRLVQT